MNTEIIIPIIFVICVSWFGFTYLFILNRIQKYYGKKNNLSLVAIINDLPKPYRLFLSINGKDKSKHTKYKLVVMSNILSIAIWFVLFVSLLAIEIMKDI